MRLIFLSLYKTLAQLSKTLKLDKPRVKHILVFAAAIATPAYASDAVQAKQETAALKIPIANAGFEQGIDHWQEVNPSGKSIALSNKAYAGQQALSLKSKGAYIAQLLRVKPNTSYRLTAQVLGAGTLGVKSGEKLYYEHQKKTKKWQKTQLEFTTSNTEKLAIFASFGDRKGSFDNFHLEQIPLLSHLKSKSKSKSSSIITSSSGGFGLSPDLPPGKNFDLLDWHLSLPSDDDGDGKSDRVPEVKLARGYENPEYFYTAEDGGMVFIATIGGAKTSKNTKYTRTELREMLRRGDSRIKTKGKDGVPNKNNWVFSSAPRTAQRNAGGIDGTLSATLAVNHVTTTGKRGQVGRVIVGQIHARKDEPIRLYYRKLPQNTRGSIYAAHEISKGDDIFYEILGSKKNSISDPIDGIPLDEKFSYDIIAKGNNLKVVIKQDGKVLGETLIDMSQSGYDVSDDYMYFKAGVYNQNNSGHKKDYVQATFYALSNKHKGYKDK